MAEGRKNGERFCFILGSGASYKSGIPIGTELERTWMDEMNKTPGFDEVCKNAAALRDAGKLDYDFEKEILPKWKNGEKLGSEYYFDIYTLRFFPNHRNGYFKFENLFAKAKPSFGYNALVHILSDEKGSNLVITTNFDSLVEDALFIYTDKKPLVINHELLADYAEAPNVKRPIVAKVHRGLFFDPLNRKEETEKLKGNWAKVLESIFHVYTPVVIGYGGGDKSLMDLLEDKAVKMKNGIYWCYLENSGLPDERILKLISDKNGWLVKIKGFDAVMLALGNALVPDKIEPQSVRDYLKKQCDDRIYGYENHYSELMEESSVEDKSGKSKLESESEREFKEDTKELDKRVEDTENRKPTDELTAWDYLRKGYRAFELKEYDKAIENYDKAIELNPEYAKAYYFRGYAYYNLKDYGKAIEDYSKAMELNPEDAVAYNNLGNAYAALKDYDKAIENYSKAIELNPEDAYAYCFRGDAYDDLKEYNKAIEDYSKAIELNPEDAYAYCFRGLAYAALKEYDKAIEDYSKAIKLNPEDAYAYNNRGIAYYESKEYDKAKTDIEKSLELDPDSGYIYDSLGELLLETGKYDEAIENFTRAIELGCNEIETYEKRAKAYEAIGETEKAEADRKTTETLSV